MRASTLLILFSFFQVLFCDLDGLTRSQLHDIYVKSLPYLKAFHPESITIPSSWKYMNLKFNYNELTNNSTDFKFDEFNVLHVKFVNLQAKLNGTYRTGSFWTPNYRDFVSVLNNITYEQTFNVLVNKNPNGTKTFKYKKVGVGHLEVPSHARVASVLGILGSSTQHQVEVEVTKLLVEVGHQVG